MMTCSAPSRRAAMTPHKPTAPSPITAARLPGPTFAVTAAWWPVPMTSDSVRSDGIRASSAPTGRTKSVPSLIGPDGWSGVNVSSGLVGRLCFHVFGFIPLCEMIYKCGRRRYFQSPQGKELAHKCFVEAEVVFDRILTHGA